MFVLQSLLVFLSKTMFVLTKILIIDDTLKKLPCIQTRVAMKHILYMLFITQTIYFNIMSNLKKKEKNISN